MYIPLFPAIVIPIPIIPIPASILSYVKTKTGNLISFISTLLEADLNQK